MKSPISTFLKHVLSESIESISLQDFQLNPKPFSFSLRTQVITQRYQDFLQITHISSGDSREQKYIVKSLQNKVREV